MFLKHHKKQMKKGSIRIIHNPNGNVGGSGGFQYGLELIRNAGVQYSHVAFMDDDVEIAMGEQCWPES